jgi:EmrB/QacA subfamily drug resistance transporter
MAVDVVESPRAEAAASEPHPHRWRILVVSLVIGFMTWLDVTIVNVAIPSMEHGLDTRAATVQWVVSGYALALGLTLVAGGRLGDAYGRRRMMLIGLCGFVLSSAAVGFAPNVDLVIAARLAQGASAGLLTPQSSGLIQQLFRGRERARAFGMYAFTVSVSSASGPVLGGLILALAGGDQGWRWLFWVNVPIGVFAVAAVLALVPGREPTTTGAAKARIDVRGALLLGGTVIFLLYPVVSIERDARWPLALLPLVPLCGWAFLRWEHRVVARDLQPLLDIGLLRRMPSYGNGLAVGALYYTGYTGVLLVVSVYLQDALNLSALHTGLLIMPFAAGSAISAPIAARYVTTEGRRISVLALALVMTGVLLVALLAPGHDTGNVWLVLVPALLVAGLGAGGVNAPNNTLTLSDVPPRMGGAAGGGLQTANRIGASIGAALLMTAYELARGPVPAGQALRVALLVGLAFLSAALLMAIRALGQQNRPPRPQDPELRQRDATSPSSPSRLRTSQLQASRDTDLATSR